MANEKPDRADQLQDAKYRASDYQVPDEVKQPAKRPRTMKQWRSYVEESIQSAMDEGRFDNLPGSGQPIQREALAGSDAAEEMANGILKNNGFTPDWIDRDLSIRKDIEAARESLQAAWRYYQPNPESDPGWHRAVGRFEEALEKINKQIEDFNLVVPILSKQRMKHRLEDELRLVKG